MASPDTPGPSFCKAVTSWWKPLMYSTVKCVLAPVVKPAAPKPLVLSQVQRKKYIIAFCGSGTGHLTQALAVSKLLEKKGMELAGVVIDEDASPKMVDELITPLGVPVLTLPAISLVDGQRGMVPIPCVLVSALKSRSAMQRLTDDVTSFLDTSGASLIVTFWHITFAYFLQNYAIPKTCKVVHIAAQFAHGSLDVLDLQHPLEVIGKCTIDSMASVFANTGVCVRISPKESPDSIAPILEVPAVVGSMSTRLILCYFLVQSDAQKLERLLHKHPVPGVEFHCFTAQPLPKPKGRELSLYSHQKQRKLFVELFEQCTGVIVSTGNETIWEAVCRGVPVVTVPTTGHPEQFLNAAIHGANFPSLLRVRTSITKADIDWLISFEPSAEAQAERSELRQRVTDLYESGSPLLSPPSVTTATGQEML